MYYEQGESEDNASFVGTSTESSNNSTLRFPLLTMIDRSPPDRSRPHRDGFGPSKHGSPFNRAYQCGIYQIAPDSSRESPAAISNYPVTTVTGHDFTTIVLGNHPPFLPHTHTSTGPTVIHSRVGSHSGSTDTTGVPGADLPTTIIISATTP